MKTTQGDKEKSREVTAGVVGRLTDYAFNPTRDKMREMTIVDRVQARQFPLLDMIAMGRRYCIDVAQYMEDVFNGKKPKIKPLIPDLLDEFIFRTAQWQKSIAGMNLNKATDIALAEIESQMEKESDLFGGEDPFKDK